MMYVATGQLYSAETEMEAEAEMEAETGNGQHNKILVCVDEWEWWIDLSILWLLKV